MTPTRGPGKLKRACQKAVERLQGRQASFSPGPPRPGKQPTTHQTLGRVRRREVGRLRFNEAKTRHAVTGGAPSIASQ